MRSLSFFLTLVATTYAAVEIPVARHETIQNVDRSARLERGVIPEKRQVSTNVFEIDTWSLGSFYINITVGTPPQLLTVYLVTSLPDLVLNVNTAPSCRLPANETTVACQGGTFDVAASTTYHEISHDPSFNYTDGIDETATGPYGSDIVGINDILVTDVIFALAEEVNSTVGPPVNVFGLGYNFLESNQSSQGMSRYPNFPSALVQSGAISSRLYSLYLGDQVAAGASTGSLLFGAVDTSKYTGPLITVNFLPESDTSDFIYQPIVPVTSVSVSNSESTSQIFSGSPSNFTEYYNVNQSWPSLLDSGTAFWVVPQSYYSQIAEKFPYVNREGYANCSDIDPNAQVSLTFGEKATITVSSQGLFVPATNDTSRKLLYQNFNGVDELLCAFNIASSPDDSGFWVVGAPILASMYTVFDLDNGQASIAQAAVNVTAASNIVDVPAGPNGIAEAVSGVVAAASNTFSIDQMITTATYGFSTISATTAVGTATGLAAVPVDAQILYSSTQLTTLKPTGTRGATATGSSHPTPHHSDAGAIAGGVVGGIAGLALILGAIFYFMRRRKIQARKAPQMREVQSEWNGGGPHNAAYGSPAMTSTQHGNRSVFGSPKPEGESLMGSSTLDPRQSTVPSTQGGGQRESFLSGSALGDAGQRESFVGAAPNSAAATAAQQRVSLISSPGQESTSTFAKSPVMSGGPVVE